MNRRNFIRTLGISSAGMMFSGNIMAGLPGFPAGSDNKGKGNVIKPITGSWIEFQHHLSSESEYWDGSLAKFSAAQWREKIFEMKGAGMKYLVLMSVALFGKTLYPSKLLPQMKLGCDDPLEVVLSAADDCGIKFFISNGYWGDVHEVHRLMVDPEIMKIRFASMKEIAEKYAHHKSFYGWYFPNEVYLRPYFPESSVTYINKCSEFARKITPDCVNLIAPYYIKAARNDDTFVKQLEGLNIDIIAYQDGVGVKHTELSESGKYFKILHDAHQRACRSRIWADMELFYFENGDHGNLMPADFDKRIKIQMANISPYVDNILCYQYIGLMNKPGTDVVAGTKESIRLYNQYISWLLK